jgi:uncharacterized protein YjbI with pentapeptide repeats
MANPEHISTIRQGVDVWNHWRVRHPHTFPDLSGADLGGLNLKRADLRDTNLSGADLSNADLSEVELCHANLERATLRKAELFRTDFFSAVLSGADMSESNLSYAILVEANLHCAKISGCQIYGLSAWNIKEKPGDQANLIISCKDNPTITVNNIEMGQLIFVLYNNKKIRDLIDTVAEEVVLILGRFTEARKNILDAIRGRLAHLDYSPILFDFDRPSVEHSQKPFQR